MNVHSTRAVCRGYGAAISVVLAIIIMLITIVQMVVKKYWVNSND